MPVEVTTMMYIIPCYDNDILIGALVARDKIRAVASRDEDFNDTNVGKQTAFLVPFGRSVR